MLRNLLHVHRQPWAAVLALSLTLATNASEGKSPTMELTLENGMRVLLLPHPGSGLIASNVFVGAGSTREQDRSAGSSHFLEHVLFNGTTDRTQEQLYADADRIGAYNNATTRQEYTHYMMVAPVERMAEALDIQADMLLRSTLPQDKFEKERGIVLEELSKDKDDPDYRLQRTLDALRYGSNDDFARPILGTAETIQNLPRDNVVDYYKRQYVPSNMRLVLMGDFKPESALDLVRRTFRLEDPERSGVAGTPQVSPACLLAHTGFMATEPLAGQHTVVELLVQLPDSSPEQDAVLALLTHVAGQSESSRLKRALDEEPAVPNDESSAAMHFRKGGRFLELTVRSSKAMEVQEAARRLMAALHSLSRINDDELAAARTSLLTQEVSQLEKLHYYALFQGDRLWHMQEGFTARYLAAIEQANATSLGQAARRLLQDANIQVVAVGPGLTSGTTALTTFEPRNDFVQRLQPRATGAALEVQRHRPPALEEEQAPRVLHLENGLTLVHAAAPTTRMFALHLLVKNRSAREPEHAAGIADLLHRSLTSSLKADGGGPSRLDLMGAELKVADNPWIPYDDYYTTPLYSFVRLECVDEYYREALDAMAQMLKGPHDDAKALDEARAEMMAAMQRGDARPGNKSRDRLNELLYPGHPLAHSVMGNTENLSSISTATLEEFARHYFSPDELVLAVVGNIPRAEARARVEATLGTLQRSSSSSTDIPAPPVTEHDVREEIEGGGNQSSLRIGRVVEIDSDDRWALIVATQIASSRMQQDLRETRGLAYSLGISLDLQGRRASILASMGTRPENIAEAEAGMRSYVLGGELDVAEGEIETAVNKHLSRMRMRRITSMGQAFALSQDVVLHSDVDYAKHEAQGLMSVTPADVRRVAGRYLSKGPAVTVIAR